MLGDGYYISFGSIRSAIAFLQQRFDVAVSSIEPGDVMHCGS